MHKVLLSIGSNTDACMNMKQAIEHLLSYFPSIIFTSTIETEPHGEVYTTPFLNALAYFRTKLSKDDIQLQLKTIEKVMGRKPTDKAEGRIIIDIDLVKWDNEVLKPDDLEHNYMQQLLFEIEKITNHQL